MVLLIKGHHVKHLATFRLCGVVRILGFLCGFPYICLLVIPFSDTRVVFCNQVMIGCINVYNMQYIVYIDMTKSCTLKVLVCALIQYEVALNIRFLTNYLVHLAIIKQHWCLTTPKYQAFNKFVFDALYSAGLQYQFTILLHFSINYEFKKKGSGTHYYAKWFY